jgi:hypothetical protein
VTPLLASIALPLALCGAGAAGDVWSTQRALTAGAVEVGPAGPSLGARVGVNVAACGIAAWADTSIQRSAHPRRAWILRGALLIFHGWEVQHNLQVAAHPHR